ncbi:MAG: phytanoyl-CoA dioxygenase family protein [Gammaproteobacteria bacterium]|nr:phytanoyl-CoA dioxygenase family protein [Gammaproteobacteria bacterium]
MSRYGFDDLERAYLAEQGYVLREAVFSSSEVSSIADSCEAVLVRAASGPPTRKIQMGRYLFEINPDLMTVVKWEPENPDQLQGLEPFAHFDSTLDAWGRDPRFVDPMRDILETEAPTLFTEKLNVKRAHVGGSIFLHQDRPYWVENSENADEIATAVLFLDDATRNNGCLEVVPGSHLNALQKGREVEGFGSFEMDPDQFDTDELVALEVQAGSVVFFGSKLVHRSLPNTTGSDRRTLLYSYQPAGRSTSAEFLASIIADRSLERA